MAYSKPLKEKVLGSVVFKSSVNKVRRKSREPAINVREHEDVQLKQVKEKLQEANDEYRDMDDDQLSRYAQELIDKERIKIIHFSHLLQEEIIDAIDRTASDAEAFPGGQIQHTREHQAVRTRAVDRFTRVSHFPVKLLLSRLDSRSRMNRLVSSRPGSHLASMMRLAYGPLHAALVVDDVKIEWNASSLVIPEMFDPLADGTHDFQTEVRGQGGLGARVMERGPEIGATLEREMDFSRQIDLMLAVNADKAALIDKLAGVIVRYNKAYYYHPIVRNCQHFVMDAMAALEITNPPQFQGRLGEYYDYLRQRRKSALREFTTHADLDTYVKDNLDSVTCQEDMEYLHCLYFQFHMQAGMREAENWVCPEDSCKMGELAERIQRLSRSLLIEQFLPSRADGDSQ